MCNEAPDSPKGSAISWVEVLFADSMNDRVRVDDRDRKTEDMTVEGMLGIVAETAGMVGPSS